MFGVVIGSGRIGANTWSLLASQDAEGQLCLSITWRPRAGDQDDGCGFGSDEVHDGGRGTAPTDTGQAEDGSVLAFGPSPAGATRVILRTPRIGGTGCGSDTLPPTSVPITHHMPSWFVPRHTGWFTLAVRRSALDCVIDARFLDAHGHEVPQPNDY